MKRVQQIGVVVGLQVAGTVEDDGDGRVAGASCDLLRLGSGVWQAMRLASESNGVNWVEQA